jgi:chromosome segregation ATPase
VPTSNEEVESLEQQVASLRDQIEQARQDRAEVQTSRVNDHRAEQLRKEAARLQAQLDVIKSDTQREKAVGTDSALRAMQEAVQRQADQATSTTTATPTTPVTTTTPTTAEGTAQAVPTPTGAEAKVTTAADAKAAGQEGR